MVLYLMMTRKGELVVKIAPKICPPTIYYFLPKVSRKSQIAPSANKDQALNI